MAAPFWPWARVLSPVHQRRVVRSSHGPERMVVWLCVCVCVYVSVRARARARARVCVCVCACDWQVINPV